MGAYLHILIMAIVAFGVAGLFLLLAHLLGPKHPTKRKQSTYECGVPVEGKIIGKFPVKFYLVVILFLIFDLEVVFLYPWAVQRGQVPIWLWLVEGLIFAAIILCGWYVAVKRDVLEWGAKREVKRVEEPQKVARTGKFAEIKS